MIHLRRIFQILFFVLFLSLFFLTKENLGTNTFHPVLKFFFNIDPLLAAGVFLASHKILSGMVIALAVVVLTFLFGRFFCSWICPLGAINHFFGFIHKKNDKQIPRRFYTKKQNIKYIIFILFIAAAVFSVDQIGLLDPISFLVRSVVVGIIPILQFATTAVFEFIFYFDIEKITAIAGPLFDFIKNTFYYFTMPHFSDTILISVIFIAVIALNSARPRFWCRFICPLGAMLGLLSHFAPYRLKMNDKCTHCLNCVSHCEGACNPHLKDGWISRECVMCYNCVHDCPEGALEFKFPALITKTEPKFDISRRRVITAGLIGIFSAPLLRQQFWSKRVNPSLIRPPGACAEPEFLAKCVKCGNCMKVCPTNFLQPALLEGGAEGVWSPIGVGRKGYCEFECSLCGQACPTGAIENLPLEEKKNFKIGIAWVDKSRCIPYVYNTPCIVCEEHCPTPEKAITLEQVEAIDALGNKITFGRPVVSPSLCIGCAICENVCPVVDKPAVYVTSIGEWRSRENKLLLGQTYRK